MPKKPPPNGYYFFMREWKEREERLGRRFPNGMKDVANLASEEWKCLPPAEKERFNKIAKEHRHDPRPNIPKKEEKRFNSQGISFAEIERAKKDKEERIKLTKEYVHNLVNNMSLEDLKQHVFYLIHVNYFCKTDHDEYLPAEIAISEFSLLKGIHKFFHRFLSPGEIPPGYASDVKEHSDKYHRIAFSSTRHFDKYDEVYHHIRNFMQGKFQENTIEAMPLFTLSDNIFDNTSTNAVKKTLQTLWESVHYGREFSTTWENVFGVYSAAQLLYEIKQKVLHDNPSGILPFPNDVLADAELRKDLYHFRSEMACKFHQNQDNLAFCSQSYVIRWAHIIRDHCCQHLGITDIVLPNSYKCDTHGVENLELNSLNLNEDEVDDDGDYDDARSTRSGFTSVSVATEKSVGFSSVKSVKSEKTVDSCPSVGTSTGTGLSWSSALSQPKPGTTAASVNSWATASSNQSKKAPIFDNKNFPSLGCGRGRIPLEKRNNSWRQ